MKILFIHSNFPAQFGYFAEYLTQRGWEVSYLTQRPASQHPEFDVVVYKNRSYGGRSGTHPFTEAVDDAIITGSATLEVCAALARDRGWKPDIVMAHSGWGNGMFLRSLWPDMTYVPYCEWFYHAENDDVAFFEKSRNNVASLARSQSRNMPILMDLSVSDTAVVPTNFQKLQFPPLLQSQLTVMHDGIDTDFFAPHTPEPFNLDGVSFSPVDEILTFVARGMEPYRGFPEFMRMVAVLQRERPNLKTIVLGEDRVAYGTPLPEGDSWKKRMLTELKLDLSRLAMPGLVPRSTYRSVLGISSLHCFFSVPFVLSWSLLEAMSMGCLVAASDIQPVREVMAHGANGLLINPQKLSETVRQISRILDAPSAHESLRSAARQTVLDSYAQKDLFPKKEQFLVSFIKS